MAEGGELTFESKPFNKDDKTFIQVSVKDTGGGLTREQIDHMFDEFYKIDDSRHKLDSTGLGLAICRNIVEKHGGKIWADSHGENTGTTIYFTLPPHDFAYSRSF
jgi:signal transduction histidine kinase